MKMTWKYPGGSTTLENVIPLKDDLASVIVFARRLIKGPQCAQDPVRVFVNGDFIPETNYSKVVAPDDHLVIEETSA